MLSKSEIIEYHQQRRTVLKKWFILESHNSTFLERLSRYTELKLSEFILNKFKL